MTDHTAQIITALQALDPAAHVEHTGGNCRAAVADLASGQRVMITHREGGDLPDDTGALIGIYREDGDTDDDPTVTEHGPEVWLNIAAAVDHTLTLDTTRRGKA